MKKAAKKTTLGFPEKLGYAGISIADNLRTSFFSTFMLFFGTDILGIKPGLMSTLLSISIVWDAINDPLIASYADNHPNRLGERSRQYLFASIPMGIILVLMFTRFSENVATCAVIILVLNLIYSIFTTMHRIPYFSMMILVSPEEEDRISVNKYHFFGTCTGTALGAVAMWPLVRLFGGVGGDGNLINPEKGFMSGAIIVALVVFLFSLYHYFTTKERVRPQNMEKTPFLESCTLLFKRFDFRSNVYMNFFRSAIQSAITGYALYYTSYVLGNSGMLTPLYAMSLVSSMATIPFMDKIIDRIGNRKAMFLASVVQLAGEVVFVCFPRDLFAAVILVLCTGFSSSIFNVIVSLHRAKVADSYEESEGKRVDNMISNVNSFAVKCGSALITLLFGWILEFSHYDGTLDVQPESAVKGIIFIMGWFVILLIIGMIFSVPKDIDNMPEEAVSAEE